MSPLQVTHLSPVWDLLLPTHTHIQRNTVYIIEVTAINVLIIDLFLLCLFMCVFFNYLFENMVCQASSESGIWVAAQKTKYH